MYISSLPSVQLSSVAQSCPTPCDPMDYRMPGLPVYHQHPELIQTHVHRVGDAIQPSHPLLSLSPFTFNLSQHQGQISSNESVLRIRWPKYWSLSFTISPSNEYSGLISFRNPRDSQESSPTPQFTSINSSALSFHFVKYYAFLSGNLFLPLNEASQPDCEQR